MSQYSFLSRVARGCLAIFCLTSVASAANPACLLPVTVKGMVGVKNIHDLEHHWEKTQLGKLVSTPSMKPFVEDVERQVRARLMETRLRLGIQLSQLADVGTGALAIANSQPGDLATSHALLMIVEVKGNERAAEALMLSAAEKLGGGEWITLGDSRVLKSRVQGASGQPDHHVHYCVQHGHLFASDHAAGLQEAVAATKGDAPSMEQTEAFATVMKRVNAEQGDIMWYVDLFGYARLYQAMNGGGGKVVKLLSTQGFDCVKSAGGQIQLATKEHELSHQTFVYSPTGTKNLTKAAQLLAFVNSAETSQPLPWVAGSVANHFQLKFDFQSAFNGLKPLVNAIAEDDVFDSMLENIANEPNGPRINIKREVLPHLGSRVSIVSDRMPPVLSTSERLMAAVEVKNEPAIRRALARWLRTEPRLRRIAYQGHEIWEYAPEEPAPHDGLALDIEGGFGFDDVQPTAAPATPTQDLLPKIAVTVARGHVLVSTHLDYLKATLRQEEAHELKQQTDFQRTKDALEKMGGGNDTIHFFTRLDAALEVSYELVRTGRIAESQSLLGMAMRFFSQPEVQRTQQLDASNLPPFQEVSKYLGPHGLYLQEESTGWMMRGCLLKK